MGNGIENTEVQQNNDIIKIDALEQATIEVPSSDFIANSTLSRDGQDLTIEAPNGETIVISNYFMADPAPAIESPNGTVLTQNLVQSFLSSGSEYASNSTMNDESPVGAVEEMSGEATVTRVDGTTEPLTLGTPIFNGDVIETSADGAVNILFIDETSMAVSENARMSVDNYDYQAETESGVTNLSVLRGVFVYTSGLIGRDDPDDVSINTPVGSIGIRGTIIAGKIAADGESEITVVEGAIVVKNATGDVTLSEQYETVKIGGFNAAIEEHGVKSAEDVGKTYGSVSGVTPGLFSSINDNAREEQAKEAAEKAEAEAKEEAQAQEDSEEQQQEEATEEKQERIELKEEITEEIIDTSESQAREKYFKQSADNAQEEFAAKIQEALAQNNVDGNKLSRGKASLRQSISKRLAKDIEEQNFVNSQNQNVNAESQATLESKLTVNGSPLAQQTVHIVAGSLPADIFLYDLGNDGDYDHVRGVTDRDVSIHSDAGAIEFYHVDAGGNIVVDQTIDNPTPLSGDNFGSDVTFLGDFNGDGETDFIVGAENNNNFNLGLGVNNSAGSAFLYTSPSSPVQILGTGNSSQNFGKHVFNAGDLNADGYTDVVISSESSGHVLFGGPSSADQTEAGLSKFVGNIKSAGAAGDINGDGHDDFGIIVRDGNDMITYIVYGDQGASTMDAAFLNDPNNALKIVHSGGYANGSSYNIDALGDVNGDGFDDFRISNADIPFVVYGGKGVNDTDVVQDGDALDGSAGEDGNIYASASNQALVGDVDFYVDGMSYSDVSMRGGGSGNEFKITDANFKNIDGGNGNDSIKFFTSGGTLDFSSINYEQVSQIEQIEFGAGSQTIQLTEENLFNFLKTSDNNKLAITGIDAPTTGDNVLQFDGSTDVDTQLTSYGFTNNESGGDADSDGYIHYSLGHYDVYIDVDVNV